MRNFRASRDTPCLPNTSHALNINEFGVNVDEKKKKKKKKIGKSNFQAFAAVRANWRTRYALSCEKNCRAALVTRDERHRRVLPGKIICVDTLELRGLARHTGVHVHKVCVTFTRAHMYIVAHVCGMEESLERVVARSGPRGRRRGRIGASEAEASLLGDYGSLIPIQRSELHAKRKSRPPESRRYHAENVWSRRRSPLLVMSVLRVAPVKVAPLKMSILKRARLFPLWFHEPMRTWVARRVWCFIRARTSLSGWI